MPADYSRLSFDQTKKHARVLLQQGRVSLDSDYNEAQQIAAEGLRAETVEIIGVVGTPDDGYGISFPSGLAQFDFAISAGTMYVGGNRVTLDAQASYLHQPDWIDPTAPNAPNEEFIYLRVEEREISAVEDSTLREVALGGPDTAQRARLMQRIVRVNTTASDCATAFTQEKNRLAGLGFTVNPDDNSLTSGNRLLVGFVSSGASATPCDPPATGGYLGAENQLIRVKVTESNKLVWGFDDASFLYRVDMIDNTTLKLQTPPPDPFHFPCNGQTIELLRLETTLPDGEPIAYADGLMQTLNAAYVPETQTIKLPSALPAAFQTPNGTPRLFVRVWEQELAFTSNNPVTLGSTGITVTLSAAGLHTGDYWAFAVRPSTPVDVYPARYKQSPQPPEGPRRWLCPLAVIGWNLGGSTGGLLADCRQPFDNLVDLSKPKPTGCCTINLRPADLENKSLQSIIDALPQGVPVRVCLSAGEYKVREPIVFKRSDVTVESCPAGAVLRAVAEFKSPLGMILILQANRIAFRHVRIIPAAARLATTRLAGLTTAELNSAMGATPNVARMAAAIAVRVFQSNDVSFEDCEFVLPGSAPANLPSLYAAAVAATGDTSGLTLRRNRFSVDNDKPQVLGITREDFRIWLGLVQSFVVKGVLSTAAGAPAPGVSGEIQGSTFARAEIRDNTFSGLTAAVLVQGETGAVTLAGNRAESCFSGYFCLSPHTTGFVSQIFQEDHKDLGAQMRIDLFLADPVIRIALTMARSLEHFGFIGGRPFPALAFPANPLLPPPNPTDLQNRFFRLFSMLNLFEQNAFKDPSQLAPDFHIDHNRAILSVVQDADNQALAGYGVVALADDLGRVAQAVVTGTAIVDDNHCRGSNTSAIIALVSEATVTGNVFVNSTTEGVSLIAMPAQVTNKVFGVAVTGNTLRGRMFAPVRTNVAAPLNVWDVFNTIMQ